MKESFCSSKNTRDREHICVKPIESDIFRDVSFKMLSFRVSQYIVFNHVSFELLELEISLTKFSVCEIFVFKVIHSSVHFSTIPHQSRIYVQLSTDSGSVGSITYDHSLSQRTAPFPDLFQNAAFWLVKETDKHFLLARSFLSGNRITELLFPSWSRREKGQLFTWTNMTTGVRSPNWLVIVAGEN